MATSTLTWTANTEPDLAGYKVYRGLGLTTPTLLATLGKVTTYVDSTVPNVDGTANYFLTAFDTAVPSNESLHSVTVTKTFDATPPQAPVGLAVA